MPAETVLAAVAVALLAYAAGRDVATRIIPNALSLGVAALGLVLRAQAGDLPLGLAAAAVVFLLGLLAWRVGALGGGDVKLLAAAALLPPPELVPTMLVVVALCGGVLALLVLAARPLVPTRPSARPASWPARIARIEAWRVRRRGPLPYAVAIAGGALLTITA